MNRRYYTSHVLQIVEQLHSWGFLHNNVHPTAFVLRHHDTAGEKWGEWNPALHHGWQGKGLAVHHLSHAIDTSLYPPNTQFIGHASPDDTAVTASPLWFFFLGRFSNPCIT